MFFEKYLPPPKGDDLKGCVGDILISAALPAHGAGVLLVPYHVRAFVAFDDARAGP
jgi:hypothetical protein